MPNYGFLSKTSIGNEASGYNLLILKLSSLAASMVQAVKYGFCYVFFSLVVTQMATHHRKLFVKPFHGVFKPKGPLLNQSNELGKISLIIFIIII